jgi:DNA-binding SARP family transcriptional activator
VRNNLALVYQLRGEPRRAEEELAAAQEIAQRLRWWRVALEIRRDRAENLLELEGPHAALHLYEDSEDLARRVAPVARIGILAGQARCLRHLGRYSEALRLAREGLDAAVAGAMAFEAAECRLELGAARLTQVPEEALPLLREAETALTGLGRKRVAARAAAVLATALFAAGEYDEAWAALDRAYAQAGGGGLYLAPEFAVISGLPLLRRAARHDGRYAAWLEAVQRYLDAEHQEELSDTGDAGAPLHLVRGRPRLLEVYSLGQASVYRDGTALSREWQTATAKELFFYFVEHPDGGRKETILAALWPDQSPTRANDNFHTSLRRLRNALGMEMVKMEDNVYKLSPTLALWHDGTEAGRLIERARQTGAPDEARRWWAAAAELLQGPFADEFYRDWAGARRQFWETRTREALGWLADDALRQQAFEAAAGWAQRLLALDPLDEAAHALLMRIYAAAGNMIMLDQQYNELGRVIQMELGGAPSAEIRALYQRLREPAVGAQRKFS